MIAAPRHAPYMVPMAKGHDHEEPKGAELVAAARDALAAAGTQWTPLRARVYEVLSGFAKPASAYDIADVLSREDARRVAANSVYRILDLFVDANVAQRVESANAYLANPHPECAHDCIFLVCNACGGTEHLDDDAIARSLRSAASGAGFTPVRPVIEVRGRCRACVATD